MIWTVKEVFNLVASFMTNSKQRDDDINLFYLIKEFLISVKPSKHKFVLSFCSYSWLDPKDQVVLGSLYLSYESKTEKELEKIKIKSTKLLGLKKYEDTILDCLYNAETQRRSRTVELFKILWATTLSLTLSKIYLLNTLGFVTVIIKLLVCNSSYNQVSNIKHNITMYESNYKMSKVFISLDAMKCSIVPLICIIIMIQSTMIDTVDTCEGEAIHEWKFAI